MRLYDTHSLTLSLNHSLSLSHFAAIAIKASFVKTIKPRLAYTLSSVVRESASQPKGRRFKTRDRIFFFHFDNSILKSIENHLVKAHDMSLKSSKASMADRTKNEDNKKSHVRDSSFVLYLNIKSVHKFIKRLHTWKHSKFITIFF